MHRHVWPFTVAATLGLAAARSPPQLRTTFLATLPLPSSSANNLCFLGRDTQRPRDKSAQQQSPLREFRTPATPAGSLEPAGIPTTPREFTGEGNPGSSVSTAIFNLVKNVMGAGILSLPYGVAAFSSNPWALAPAAALTAFVGSLSAYCFTLIARVCALNKVETYGQAWEASLGKKYAWIIPSATTFKTFCACAAYSIIIGDSFSSLLASMDVPAVFAARTNVIVWMTTLLLLPLCLLKSLAPLAPFSLVGILGTVFTSGVLLLRFLDKSYTPGGRFFSLISPKLQPSLSVKAPIFSPMIFVLISMLSTSFMAHYNAPKFYRELEDRSVKKLGKVSLTAFNFCTAMFIFVMSTGFLTFGGTSRGLILNNYADQDFLVKICRFAIGTSIVFGYPLTFIGVRDGILDLAGKRNPSERTQTLTTLGILSIVSVLAIFLRDLGFVISFGGALLGSCIIYIFPAIIFLKTVAEQVKTGNIVETDGLKREVLFNKGIIGFGVLMALVGGTVSVLKTFFAK